MISRTVIALNVWLSAQRACELIQLSRRSGCLQPQLWWSRRWDSEQEDRRSGGTRFASWSPVLPSKKQRAYNPRTAPSARDSIYSQALQSEATTNKKGLPVRILRACALLLLCGVGTAAAQPAGPYLSGQIGTSAGDGGAALMTGAAVGYMSPKRLAFELEITVSPSLEFDPPPVSILAIFPAPRFESEGRMIWFQTNAIGTLVDAGKLRVAVVGGGGAANLHREINYSILFTAVPTFPTVLPPPFDFGERTITQSETALALNAGGIVDYEVTRHFRVGADVRYMHAFFSEPWQAGRVTARVQWQF